MAEKTIRTIPAPLPEELVVRRPEGEHAFAIVEVADRQGIAVPVEADELAAAVEAALNEGGTGRVGFEADSIEDALEMSEALSRAAGGTGQDRLTILEGGAVVIFECPAELVRVL